ncbi:MAG: DUF3499 family protein, partial [Acidimicrobiia bacterium]|nr:DUF3499 family protein [Acidimicrobiia bacterium]
GRRWWWRAYPEPATSGGWVLEWRDPAPYREEMLFSCVRCSSPASTLMMYSYADRLIWLDDLTVADAPGYAMCGHHAGRLTPPLGWTLTDRRTVIPLFAPLEVA